jgi:hypothetical protein
MSASQLDLLPSSHAAALLRKRRFWKRTMWVSLVPGVILALAAVSGTVISMTGAFSELEKTGAADPAALARDISAAMLITVWTLPPACLAFVFTLVSFIRLLSLPRA